MGRLVKNHWARLIMLSAATYQIAAGLAGLFWPKILFDFRTRNFDLAVMPFPFLQTINMAFGLFMLVWEYPINILAGSSIHRSIVARLVFLPLTIMVSLFLYQGTNSAIYYAVGLVVYFYAYIEGEDWNANYTVGCCAGTMDSTYKVKFKS